MSFPNVLTCCRILICPFFFTALLAYDSGDEKHRFLAVLFFVAAALTDAVDGFLARLLKQQTVLGKFLDPLADKLLLLTGYIGVMLVHPLIYHPPLWVLVTIVFRDLIILGGMMVFFLATGTPVEVRPDTLGKTATVFQMITLAAILFQSPISVPLWNVTAVLTILSCLGYMVRELLKFKRMSLL